VADTKLSALTTVLRSALASGDLFYVVQVSGPTSKGITVGQLLGDTLRLGSGNSLTSSPQTVQDGGGTASALQVSTLGVAAVAGGSTAVPLTVKGAASQSADLQRWQSSTPTTLALVDKDGNIGHGGSIYNKAGGEASATVITAIAGGIFQTGLGLKIEFTPDASWPVLSANNPGGDLRLTGNRGNLWVPGINGEAVAVKIQPKADAIVGLFVRAFSAGQTANLQEWQDSLGTPLAAVTKNGAFVPAHLADASAANDTVYYSTTAGKLVYKDSGGTVNNLY
jgi:hypothetical protein